MYTLIGTGLNLSTFVTTMQAQHEAMRSLERSTNAGGPTVKPIGLVHNVTDNGTYGELWRRWNGTAWTSLLDPEAMQLNAAGSVPLAANLPMGGFVLTGMGAGSANGQSVRYEQVLLRSGTQEMLGDLDMDGNSIVGLPLPTTNDEPATKEYVDANTGVVYFQTNRDYRGNGRPLKYQTDADPTNTYTNLGFVPREVTLYLKGRLYRQDNNGNPGGGVPIDLDHVVELLNFETDSTGGYTAPSPVSVALSVSGVTIQVCLTWKTTGDLGFTLALRLSTTSGQRLKLKVSGAPTGADGVLQVIAKGGKLA